MSIRVRPGASRTRVGGSFGAGEQRALGVAVAARAVDGAATEAALAAVAEAFGVSRRDVAVVSGATARTKVVDVRVDPHVGEERLRSLLG